MVSSILMQDDAGAPSPRDADTEFAPDDADAAGARSLVARQLRRLYRAHLTEPIPPTLLARLDRMRRGGTA
ncbi:MAG: hypothetical protein KGL11_11230 [Alphaproteobacteria bacterium]|nr:hypothetical protein [Alphaproteobacteria bacterium]